MKIHGFQKLTLLDFPGRVACTVFTAGCNYRCPFCHNATLVTGIDPKEELDENEILAYLKKRVGILEGVAITGGEPLLQHDIAAFLAKVKEMGYPVKLDTNGSSPDKLSELVDKGLVDYVAMDVKNSPEKYAVTAGVNFDILPLIEKSIALLKEGRVDYEFRTTVMKELHTPEDMEGIGRLISGARRAFIQPYKESGKILGEVLNGKSHIFSPPDSDTLARMVTVLSKYADNVALRGDDM